MKRFLLAIFLLLSAAHPVLAVDGQHPVQKANLTILADENMLLPLAQLARAYATETGTPLTIVLKNTKDAEDQIEQGLEAHLLITANYPLIERLAAQGLTDISSRRAVARTQLALVSAAGLSKPAQWAKRVSFAAMLYATPTLPVFAPSDANIDGERVKALLSGKEFSETLAARIKIEPAHEDVIEALRDNEGLGLFLAADAAAERDLNVIALLTDDVSPPVNYDALVLAGESMTEANQFINFLSAKKAQTILSHFGFQTPK